MIPAIDETHDPDRRSWVEAANHGSDFPIQNLPLGVFDPGDGSRRPGVAIGDRIVDLSSLVKAGLLGQGALAGAAQDGVLNSLLAASAVRQALRRRLSDLLRQGSDERPRVEGALHPMSEAALQLPARIGGYTDFYAGIVHARRAGALMRPDNPLMPNYRHMPIGYHGRASSIRVSGGGIRRPLGQVDPGDEARPTFRPSARLDYELELAVWIGEGNPLGVPIPLAQADEHIAGFSLLNDWSARDVQTWEYRPLGPFLAKSFATTISPWIVTAEALAPFRAAPRPREADAPTLLPYLLDPADRSSGAYRIELQVGVRSARMRAAGADFLRLGRCDAQALYWTPAQLVAHHTCGGCNLEPGDLLGTGTIAEDTDEGYGSLLERTRGGAAPFELPSGETRVYLQDWDEVCMTARASAPGRVSIGFGECRATILPAVSAAPA